MESTKKKTRLSLSAFKIILIMIYVLAIVTHLLPEAQFAGEALVDGSGVVKATLSQTLMAPVYGFVGADGIDGAIRICFFVLILGAFLKMVNSTNAIEDGIKVLIRKLHGKELILIPILMIIFSIGGTTYGMLEETVGFYAILAVAMVASGMDTIVSSAVVLLGAGSGVLGSTVNPFAVGAAVDAAKGALPEGFAINQGTIIGLGTILWLSTLAISIFFVMRYAKKVIKKKGSTFLSLQEQKDMNETYENMDKNTKAVKMDGKQKITLWLFGFTFLIMIIGFIPWEDLAPGVFDFFAKGVGEAGLLVEIGSLLWVIAIFMFVIIGAKLLIKKMNGEALNKCSQIMLCLSMVMIVVGVIFWKDLSPYYLNAIPNWISKLVGEPLGYWYFNEASLWFLIMTIVIGIVNGYRENKIVDIFIDGADDMVSVILVIAVARGASILMQQTHLDNYIIFNVSNALQNVPKTIFAPLNYILHVGLSVLVPSSSGLATLSSPIMGPLAYQIGYNVEVTLMEMVAANGLVNLFTPTCGAIMGGLALAKVQYTTWLRWVSKVIITIAIANMIILTVAMVVL